MSINPMSINAPTGKESENQVFAEHSAEVITNESKRHSSNRHVQLSDGLRSVVSTSPLAIAHNLHTCDASDVPQLSQRSIQPLPSPLDEPIITPPSTRRKRKNSITTMQEQTDNEVQGVDIHSPTVTIRDVKAIQSFFVKPLEDIYEDAKTGKTYIQPNHSQLLVASGPFVMKGAYAGVGLLRHVNVGDKLCDIVYLKKKKDQVDFESGEKRTYTGFLYSIAHQYLNYDEVKSRIATQTTLATELAPMIQHNYQAWNYASYEFCDATRLKVLFENPETAEQNHAILFYYKEIPSVPPIVIRNPNTDDDH